MEVKNQLILKAKSENKTPNIELLTNRDSLKQLLARSRYLLYKTKKKWTNTQKERTRLLFELYPEIKIAYKLSQQLRNIYNNNNYKNVAILN